MAVSMILIPIKETKFNLTKAEFFQRQKSKTVSHLLIFRMATIQVRQLKNWALVRIEKHEGISILYLFTPKKKIQNLSLKMSINIKDRSTKGKRQILTRPHFMHLWIALTRQLKT